jgi:pimeloyl-ACP methyl ester carboxylesterase
MGLFFDDPLFEEYTVFALALASHGGSELGEVQATIARIEDGNDDSWFAEWRETADGLVQAGDESAAGGHRVSARDSYLRATFYYCLAYHPLYGAPVDPRLVEAFASQRNAFDKAAALLEPAGEPIEIPLAGAQMPGYLFRAEAGERRPLLIAMSGYDSTIYESYLAQAIPALRRGYHCLVFDGPGQGAMLIEQEVTIRPDWETVLRPVVDAALGFDDVDPERIALTGWSLGGYLALRAASGEPRLAACIADPALLSMAAGLPGRLAAAGVPQEAIDRYPDIDAATLAPMVEAVHSNRAQRWAIERRGLWVHGLHSVEEYLQAISEFTTEGRLGSIRCPTVLTEAENDPLARSAQQVYDALTCPKTLLKFEASKGAGDHCEMRNRSLLDQRVFDWLDDVFAAG